MPSYKEVAIVVGASRGIGRQIAVDLAKDGYAVVVAAKTVSDASKCTPFPPDPNSSSSTINTVVREITEAGGEALPIQLDVRDFGDVQSMVDQTAKKYGRIDVLVYNSGAIWWSSVEKTPMKRFQLMQRINPEGFYGCVQACLPYMYQNGGKGKGRIVVVSPPIYRRFLKGKTAYAMGKWAMSALTMGLSVDFEREERTEMAITSLWTGAGINSAATQGAQTDRKELRKPTIFSDAVRAILKAPPSDKFARKMRRIAALALVAGRLLNSVSAQSTTISRTLSALQTYQPTNTWTVPNGACSVGMGAAAATATAGGQGGVYQDRYGGYWEMDCGYYFSGSTYYDGAYQGTNGIGVYSCFNGCANRPGCVGFTYYGTSTGPTTGGGRCFHFFNGQQGNLSYNPSYLYADAGSYSLFGSAYLLQANENLLCPTYNGTYFLDAQGQAYYILCGYGSTSQYQNTAARDGPACLALCDAQAQCIGVTVVYGGAESNANNNANCYLASAGLNTIANTRNVLAVRTTMPSFVPTTTTTTTTTSSSSSATQVTPTAPPPSFACPADDIQQLQENGQNYYVGCGMVAQGATSVTYTATNSWNDCFGYCDATVGCTGFTYAGAADGNGPGTCLLRNSAPIGLVPSDAYHIGAVKAAYYGWQVTTTTTTTTSSSRPFTTTTTSTTTSTTTTTTSSSSSAAAQTVTYTYVSSYPVTYTTSYVTTAVSTAPGSTVISTYVTTVGIKRVLPLRNGALIQFDRHNFYASSIDKYIDNHRKDNGNIYRANHGTSNPNIYDCIIIPSHHGDCKHSIWLDHNPDYKLLCDIHGDQHDSGLFDGSSPYGNIYHCCTDGDANYGVLIWSYIYHILSRHGYGNYIGSRLDRHFHLRLVVSTQVSSYGVTTTAPGTFDRKNHCANHNCINSASIDHYPDSANDRCLYFPLDNPGHRDLYNAVFLSLHIYPCQHGFWLYYHGNFGSLSNDHPNITPSIDCREHRLFDDCIYPNSIRTNSGFDGYLYHKLRLDLSDIISGDNDIGQHRASLVFPFGLGAHLNMMFQSPLKEAAEKCSHEIADALAGSTVTTESISYATSTERTTIVSSYIGTATETTTASGPTQTVSGPTQTESGPTQTISGPTQTIQGPTQTQVITTSYVETYTTSYPVTETLPGSTEVTISYATTTVERTVVSSYISTERVSVTQTQEVTTTQAASTLYGTTTQPGVTIYGTVTATVSRSSSSSSEAGSLSSSRSSTSDSSDALSAPSSTSDSSASTTSSASTSEPTCGQPYTDYSGQTYSVQCDTALNGTTIQQAPSKRLRYRQDNIPNTDAFDNCLRICDSILECQAVSYSSSACVLYSSIARNISSPGVTVGYNVARYSGAIDQPSTAEVGVSSTTAYTSTSPDSSSSSGLFSFSSPGSSSDLLTTPSASSYASAESSQAPVSSDSATSSLPSGETFSSSSLDPSLSATSSLLSPSSSTLPELSSSSTMDSSVLESPTSLSASSSSLDYSSFSSTSSSSAAYPSSSAQASSTPATSNSSSTVSSSSAEVSSSVGSEDSQASTSLSSPVSSSSFTVSSDFGGIESSTVFPSSSQQSIFSSSQGMTDAQPTASVVVSPTLSETSSISGTSAAAESSTTISPSLACNETQQSYTYVDPTSGSTYEIECDTTYSGGISNQTQQPDMASCIASCSDHIDCDSAGYEETTGTCYEYSSQVQGSGTYNPNVQFAKVTKRAVVVDGVTYTYPSGDYQRFVYISISRTVYRGPSVHHQPAYYFKLGYTKFIVFKFGHCLCFDICFQPCCFFDIVLDKLTGEQLIVVGLRVCLNNDKLDQRRQ
ncbi:short chain dehydrogenase [Hortaea werneckii]|nr:short chain dehydrogenase [Hortaea werneckii]KAI6996889.1 short chain dehydrogenase [Hortaea werneckii]KAI7148370.1 short chain dehydrogenase [Hortaea werneckii]KAI7177602.1 short chain dehydrogenase [Hortaea werneckii]